MLGLISSSCHRCPGPSMPCNSPSQAKSPSVVNCSAALLMVSPPASFTRSPHSSSVRRAARPQHMSYGSSTTAPGRPMGPRSGAMVPIVACKATTAAVETATPTLATGERAGIHATGSHNAKATSLNGLNHSRAGGAGHGNGNGSGAASTKGSRSSAQSNGASANGSGSTKTTSSSAASTSSSLMTAPVVEVHVVVPRCTTVPGERLVLVGECDALGCWDPARGVPLRWSSGHMHTASFKLPLQQALQAQQKQLQATHGSAADPLTHGSLLSLRAKLVLVSGYDQYHRHGMEGKDKQSQGGKQGQVSVTWEPGLDRSIVLQPPSSRSSSSSSGSSNSSSGGVSHSSTSTAAAAVPVRHDYVVVCHWQHTEATSVLMREVPGEVLALERQLGEALEELRAARSAAAASQERLHRMAQDLASSDRSARQGAEQLEELQAKHSAMTAELSEARRQARAAAAEASAAAAAAASAAQASSVAVAEVEARVSERYEGRMADLKKQLEGVKGQYVTEVAALRERLEASAAKEAEAQRMAVELRDIVTQDVARLRAELAQLVNDYISAREQLQEQAQQLEVSENLRMQQIDGLSTEIKNLVSKYNSAQTTIAEQQRMLDELQASRGAVVPANAAMTAMMAAPPPPPEPQAGRDWRSDWARLRKLSATGSSNASSTSSKTGSNGNGSGLGAVVPAPAPA